MPPPLDPDKRAAIADAIRGGGKRNEIAREHDVSPSTVTSIAKTEGIDDAFDRTATKTATAARSTDLAARRVELAGLLMDDAFRLRLRLWEEHVVGWEGEGDDRVPIRALPGGRDVQSFMVAIGIAIDKVGVLTQSDGAEKEASSLIRSLVDDIRARREALEAGDGAAG